jgi:hypothetical protein
MTGFVYAMVSGNKVKFGWSAKPKLRVSKVRSDTPSAVVLVGYIIGTREQESEIHQLLSPWRVFGEWFSLSDTVQRVVSLFEGRGHLPSPISFRNDLSKEIYARGLNQKWVANQLGVHQVQLSKWARARIPAEHVLNFERITGIPRSDLRPDIYPPNPQSGHAA